MANWFAKHFIIISCFDEEYSLEYQYIYTQEDTESFFY